MYDYDPDANVIRRSTPRPGYTLDIEANPSPHAPERLYVTANGVHLKTFDSVDRVELARRANDYVDGIEDFLTNAVRIGANDPDNLRRAKQRAEDEAAEMRANPPDYEPPDVDYEAPELQVARGLTGYVAASDIIEEAEADSAAFREWLAREDETWDKPETPADYPDIDYEAGQD